MLVDMGQVLVRCAELQPRLDRVVPVVDEHSEQHLGAPIVDPQTPSNESFLVHRPSPVPWLPM